MGKSGGRVDAQSCGLEARKQPKCAERTKWEHIVPAWTFGHQRQCWQQGGRKNCVGSDPAFRAMEADLYNFYPSVDEVNRGSCELQLWIGDEQRTSVWRLPDEDRFQQPNRKAAGRGQGLSRAHHVLNVRPVSPKHVTQAATAADGLEQAASSHEVGAGAKRPYR